MTGTFKQYFPIIILFTLILANGTSHFTVADKAEGVTIIDFSLGEITLEDVDGITRLRAADTGTTADQGMPELPRFTTLFQMAPGITYGASYEVISSTVIPDIDLFPHQDGGRDPLDNTIEYRNTDFYTSNSIYPLDNLHVADRIVMRNLELQSIILTPFRYHAASRELEVFEEVRIQIYENGIRELSLANTMPRSRVFEQLYSSIVVNYEPSARDEDYQTPAILYICGGGSDGAIVNPGFLALEDWRHKRGYIVYKASTDETGTSNNAIKSYIQDAYETFDPPPEYVALVGDVEGSYDIPAWSMSGDSDHPYTMLDGTDLLPEVLVGRISVEGGTQLLVVVSKTMNYEKSIYMENNWFERAALEGDTGTSSGLSTAITNEYIQNIMLSYGMEEPEVHTTGGIPSWMQSMLEQGIGYFNYRGYIGTSGFTETNINNANNGHMTPFVTFITCSTGNFASGWGDAIIEAFIRAGTATNPKGGVAAIGTATSSTHTAPNNIVDMGVYDGLFSKGLETGAAGLFNGKLSLMNTYPEDGGGFLTNFTYWNNLMGDPAIHVWTDTPEIISADFPSVVGLGSNYLPVLVEDEDGNPVEGARVTLVTDDDEIFITRTTDEWGTVDVPLNTSYAGDVSITIHGRNLKPIEDEFEVEDNGVVVNILGDQVAVDDYAGNGDGLWNPGETINLSIPLYNYGTETGTGITASLDSDADVVTILSNDISYGSLDSGGTATGGFEVSLDPAAVDMEELDIVITITDDAANSWSSLVPVNAYGGKILFDDYQVDSGYLFHGNSAEISVKLVNAGTVGLTDVTATIIFTPTLLEISNEVLTWGDLDAGSSGFSDTGFMVDISPDIINGTVFQLEMHITSAEGYDRVEYLPLQVGDVTVTEPLGPDSQGYYIYDSGDLGYNLSVPYNWVEIDPSLGGDGISLGLYDEGNGHPVSQQSAHLDLPFPFTFYGVEYNEITVSSNGWIAFGDSELESFRNYPIPGAGGPSPMLAVFWDDLKTTTGGQAYYYLNEDEGYGIIEWSGMDTYDETDENTFQAILMESSTPTGDDDILLQYKVFNNTSNGNYSNYPPMHGGYATIGIENMFGNDGLQYTFNNQYPEAAMELSDESALFITTQAPNALLLGDVNQDAELNVQDIILIVNHTINIDNLNPLEFYLADVNGDGDVNILDIIRIINLILDN